MGNWNRLFIRQGIQSVNLSVGYHNEHTAIDTLDTTICRTICETIKFACEYSIVEKSHFVR